MPALLREAVVDLVRLLEGLPLLGERQEVDFPMCHGKHRFCLQSWTHLCVQL